MKTKKNLKSPAVYQFIIAFLIIVILAFSLFKEKEDYDKNYNVKLQIINNKNDQIADFKVSIANNDIQRRRGLMFVKHLPKNYGMLFNFEQEQYVVMWMKNTKIALDMLFIDKDNQIVHIKHNALPESKELIDSRYKVLKILEINGGLSRKFGISTGDHIKIALP